MARRKESASTDVIAETLRGGNGSSSSVRNRRHGQAQATEGTPQKGRGRGKGNKERKKRNRPSSPPDVPQWDTENKEGEDPGDIAAGSKRTKRGPKGMGGSRNDTEASKPVHRTRTSCARPPPLDVERMRSTSTRRKEAGVDSTKSSRSAAIDGNTQDTDERTGINVSPLPTPLSSAKQEARWATEHPETIRRAIQLAMGSHPQCLWQEIKQSMNDREGREKWAFVGGPSTFAYTGEPELPTLPLVLARRMRTDVLYWMHFYAHKELREFIEEICEHPFLSPAAVLYREQNWDCLEVYVSVFHTTRWAYPDWMLSLEVLHQWWRRNEREHEWIQSFLENDVVKDFQDFQDFQDVQAVSREALDIPLSPSPSGALRLPNTGSRQPRRTLTRVELAATGHLCLPSVIRNRKGWLVWRFLAFPHFLYDYMSVDQVRIRPERGWGRPLPSPPLSEERPSVSGACHGPEKRNEPTAVSLQTSSPLSCPLSALWEMRGEKKRDTSFPKDEGEHLLCALVSRRRYREKQHHSLRPLAHTQRWHCPPQDRGATAFALRQAATHPDAKDKAFVRALASLLCFPPEHVDRKCMWMGPSVLSALQELQTDENHLLAIPRCMRDGDGDRRGKEEEATESFLVPSPPPLLSSPFPASSPPVPPLPSSPNPNEPFSSLGNVPPLLPEEGKTTATLSVRTDALPLEPPSVLPTETRGSGWGITEETALGNTKSSPTISSPRPTPLSSSSHRQERGRVPTQGGPRPQRRRLVARTPVSREGRSSLFDRPGSANDGVDSGTREDEREGEDAVQDEWISASGRWKRDDPQWKYEYQYRLSRKQKQHRREERSWILLRLDKLQSFLEWIRNGLCPSASRRREGGGFADLEKGEGKEGLLSFPFLHFSTCYLELQEKNGCEEAASASSPPSPPSSWPFDHFAPDGAWEHLGGGYSFSLPFNLHAIRSLASTLSSRSTDERHPTEEYLSCLRRQRFLMEECYEHQDQIRKMLPSHLRYPCFTNRLSLPLLWICTGRTDLLEFALFHHSEHPWVKWTLVPILADPFASPLCVCVELGCYTQVEEILISPILHRVSIEAAQERSRLDPEFVSHLLRCTAMSTPPPVRPSGEDAEGDPPVPFLLSSSTFQAEQQHRLRSPLWTLFLCHVFAACSKEKTLDRLVELKWEHFSFEEKVKCFVSPFGRSGIICMEKWALQFPDLSSSIVALSTEWKELRERALSEMLARERQEEREREGRGGRREDEQKEEENKGKQHPHIDTIQVSQQTEARAEGNQRSHTRIASFWKFLSKQMTFPDFFVSKRISLACMLRNNMWREALDLMYLAQQERIHFPPLDLVSTQDALRWAAVHFGSVIATYLKQSLDALQAKDLLLWTGQTLFPDSREPIPPGSFGLPSSFPPQRNTATPMTRFDEIPSWETPNIVLRSPLPLS